MEHSDIRHKLSEYLDGSTTPDERAAIEEHLKTCRTCSDALHELQKTVEHIRSVEEIEPPEWMTQKIMANVRAEAEEKKGLFRRLLSPLSARLPVQAVAVLFLAVTAYYLYQNINRTGRYDEAPVETAGTAKQTSPMLSPPAGPEISRGPAAPAGKAPQAPEYKSLDMKYEYEKPAPPAPLGKAAPGSAPAPPTAPAPAMPAEQPATRSEAVGKGAGYADRLPEESSLDMMQKRTGQSAGFSAERKAKTAAPAPQAKAPAAVDEPDKIRLSLDAVDVSRAARDIEKIVQQLGGRVVEKSPDADAPFLTLSLDSGRIKDLETKLRTVGELKEEKIPSSSHRGILMIEIAIHEAPPRP